MRRSAIPGPKAGTDPQVRKIKIRVGIRRTVRIKRTAGTGEQVGINEGVKTGQGHTGNECRIPEPCARICPYSNSRVIEKGARSDVLCHPGRLRASRRRSGEAAVFNDCGRLCGGVAGSGIVQGAPGLRDGEPATKKDADGVLV